MGKLFEEGSAACIRTCFAFDGLSAPKRDRATNTSPALFASHDSRSVSNSRDGPLNSPAAFSKRGTELDLARMQQRA